MYAILLFMLSSLLRLGSITPELATMWLAAGGVAAGSIFLAALWSQRREGTALGVRWILGIAIAARLIVSMAPPMLESDYQRYLWDGAVTAHGINPYRYAPSEVRSGEAVGHPTQRIAALGDRAGAVLPSVNHPTLTTIYPPVAQGAFSAAYLIAPFQPLGLRIVFALADMTTLLLLMRLLRVLQHPASQILWFAWNPILLREVYSSLHMDILLLPLIVLAMLAAVRARGGFASLWLIVASAIKVWPVVLIAIVIRPMYARRKKLTLTLLGCLVLGAVLWYPVLMVPMNENSGFVAYSKGWQNNDGFFRAGIWFTERVLDVLGIELWHSHMIMRLMTGVILGLVILWQLLPKMRDGQDMIRRSLFIVGALFVLSPTQFPWYWLWCLPLLTITPSLAMMLYVALLPLYYVQDQIVYPLSHWIQHAPVWGLLIFVAVRNITQRSRAESCAAEIFHA